MIMCKEFLNWFNFIILINTLLMATGFITSHYRIKRTFLTYDTNGIVKLVLGVNLPIILAEPNRSMSTFFNIQMQYLPPPQPLYDWSVFNSTTFPLSNRQLYSKRNELKVKLDDSRAIIYKYLEGIFQNLNPFGNQDCLLRFLCHIAQHPFDIDTLNINHNLYHHLLNAIFTPIKKEDNNMLDTYLKAHQAGAGGANCRKTFPICTDECDLISRFTPKGLSCRLPSLLYKKINVHQGNGIGSLRFVSRKDCAEILQPPCSEENLEKIPPCPEKEERIKLGLTYVQPGPPNSMWEWPECCQVPCRGRPIRMDELYYKTSDKLKRKYQQTWCPCPPLHIKEIPVCCFEKYKFPTVQKRIKKRQAQVGKVSACSMPRKMDMPCGMPKAKSRQRCPRFTLKGCDAVRIPPTCRIERKRDCVPEKAPYPSYSECIRCEIDPPRPIECNCLDPPMMCHVWAEYRKRLTIVKVPKTDD